ncbi:N-acetylmuramoyl-L-alanine amidase [Brucella intermedia]|uniref:peptidoglycan recognition protein family protein n=1 Tax=Brucella TaxID=234 RepID=UPI0009D65F01|nr:N-acetylmuramoyl-L-alanine amidase [Brucella intermedia]
MTKPEDAMGFSTRPKQPTMSATVIARPVDALPEPKVTNGFSVHIIPPTWLADTKMQRIILHWTAGTSKASAKDKDHYHILIEGDGTPVKGNYSIKANEAPISSSYAAHTFQCNSGSIGLALCGMGNSTENPFDAGKYPITPLQWDVAIDAAADLCRHYLIPVTPTTVLSHAEVQDVLGIKQRGKWDVSILPFNLSLNTATKVGDAFRAAVQARI